MANDTCENKYLLWSTQLSKRDLELTKQDCLFPEGKTTHQKNENRKNCRNEKLRKASIKKAVREKKCKKNDCEGSHRNMVDWLGKESEMDAEYELCIAAAAGGQPVRKQLYIPFQTWREMVDEFFGGKYRQPNNEFLIKEKIKWDAYHASPQDVHFTRTTQLCESFDETKSYSAQKSAVAGQDDFCFSYEEFRLANLNEKKEERHYYIIEAGKDSYRIQEKTYYDTMMEGKQIKSYTVFIRDGYDTGGGVVSGGKRKSRKRTRRRRRRKKYSKKSNRKLKKKSRKRKRKKRTRRRRRKR